MASSPESSSPPPFDQLSAESATLFRQHYHLGRLLVSLRSAAWSSLHLDALASLDFWHTRTPENQWRLAVANLRSGGQATVDRLGPIKLELGSQLLVATSNARNTNYCIDEPRFRGSVRLSTAGRWYRLEGGYEGAKGNRVAISTVIAKRDLISIGDRLLLGASTEALDTRLPGHRKDRFRLSAKWTSGQSISPVDHSSVTTSLLAALKDTEFEQTKVKLGVYRTSQRPAPPKARLIKVRRQVSRRWPWSAEVVQWNILEKHKATISTGIEAKLGSKGGPILSAGFSSLLAEGGNGSQLKAKVNSGGQIAGALALFYTDLTWFAPSTVVSFSGLLDLAKRTVSFGFGLQFSE